MRLGQPRIEIERLLRRSPNLRQTDLAGLLTQGELEPVHARKAGPCAGQRRIEAQRPLILLHRPSEIARRPALSEEGGATQLLVSTRDIGTLRGVVEALS